MKAPGSATRADFLQQLIERSSETKSALSPRVPSLFEPVSASVAVTGFGIEDEPAARGEKANQEPTRLRSAPVRGTEPDTQTYQERGEAQSVDARVASLLRMTPAALRNSADTDIVPPTFELETSRRVIEKHAVDAPLAATRSMRVVQLDEQGAARTHDEAPPRATSLDSAEAGGERTKAQTAAPSPLRASVHERVIAESAQAARSIVTMHDMPDVDAPQPTPTVHVTIGRLEIRATQNVKSSKPATRTRSAQPMELEEYLKQRGGGR